MGGKRLDAWPSFASLGQVDEFVDVVSCLLRGESALLQSKEDIKTPEAMHKHSVLNQLRVDLQLTIRC